MFVIDQAILSGYDALQTLLADSRKRSFKVVGCPDLDRLDGDSKRTNCHVAQLDIATRRGIGCIYEQRRPGQTNYFFEQFEAFRRQLERHICQSRDVPTRAREGVYKFAANGVRDCHKYDRYCFGCTLSREGRQSRHGEQYVNLDPYKLFCKSVKTFRLFRRKAIFQYDVLAFNVANVLQPRPELGEWKLLFISAAGVPKYADSRNLPSCLASCQRRPRCRATEQRDEFTPAYIGHVRFLPRHPHRAYTCHIGTGQSLGQT